MSEFFTIIGMVFCIFSSITVLLSGFLFINIWLIGCLKEQKTLRKAINHELVPMDLNKKNERNEIIIEIAKSICEDKDRVTTFRITEKLITLEIDMMIPKNRWNTVISRVLINSGMFSKIQPNIFSLND